MPDNKLPVEIEVRLDKSSVDRSFADIEAKAVAAGRKIGDSMSKAMSQERQIDKQINVDRYFQQAKAIDSVTAAMQRQNEVFKQAKIRSPQDVSQELDSLRQAKKLWEDLGPATEGYKGALAQITSRTNILTEGNARARGEFHKFTAQLASTTFELTAAAYAFTIAGGALAAPAIIGGKYLKELEDVKLGITGVVMSMGSMNGKALDFGQASQIAEEQVKKLSNEAMFLAGNTLDLAKAFQAVATQGLEAGMTIDQIRTIAVAGTAAGRALGISSTTLQRDIRDMVLGIRPNSTILSASLGITKADIDRARASAGGLFEYLDGKLKGFYDAAIERNKTFSGMWEQMSEMFIRSMGMAAIPIFQTAKELILDITSNIGTMNQKTHEFVINPDFKRDLDAIMGSLNVMLKVLGGVAKALWDVREPLVIIAGINIGVSVWVLLEKQILKAASALGVYKAASMTATASSIGGAAVSTGSKSALAVGETAAITAATAATSGFTSGLAALASKASVYGLVALGIYEVEKALASQIPWLQKVNDAMSDYFDKIFNLGKYAVAPVRELDQLTQSISANEKQLESYKSALTAGGYTNALGITFKNTTETTNALKAHIVELENTIDSLKKHKGALENSADSSEVLKGKVESLNNGLKTLEESIKAVGGAFTKAAEKEDKFLAMGSNYASALDRLKILQEARDRIAAGPKTEVQTKQLVAIDKELEAFKKNIAMAEQDINYTNQKVELETKVALARGKNRDIAKIDLDISEKMVNLKGREFAAREKLEAFGAPSATDDAVRIASRANAQKSLNLILAQENALHTERNTLVAKLFTNEEASWKKHIDVMVANAKAGKIELDRIMGIGGTTEKNIDIFNAYAAEQAKKGVKIPASELARGLEAAKQLDIIANTKVEYEQKKAIESLQLSMNDQLDRYVQSQEELTKSIQEEIATTGMSKERRDMRQVEIAENKELLRIQQEFIKLRRMPGVDTAKSYVDEAEATKKATDAANEHKEAISDLANKQKDFTWAAGAGWKKYISEIEDGSRDMANTFKNIFKKMEDAIYEFVTTGKISFSGFAKSVLGDLVRIQIQKSISFASSAVETSGAFTSFASFAKNLLPFANGAVFANSPSLSSYSGNVYNSPQTFAFANGAGVFAEAGPEAIMPLHRGADGTLGVKTTGGAGDISVNVQVSIDSNGNATATTDANAQGKQLGDMIGNAIRAELIKERRNGGLLDPRR